MGESDDTLTEATCRLLVKFNDLMAVQLLRSTTPEIIEKKDVIICLTIRLRSLG